MKRIGWASILLAASLATAWGQGPANPSGPPPAGAAGSADGSDQDAGAQDRGVGRISVAQGEVSVRRGDSGESIAAVVNAPVMGDDHLMTAGGARAEVQFDAANIVRVGQNADVHFGSLESRRFQLQVGIGTVVFRVLRPTEARAEIDTPSVSVRPTQVGVYRITVREDGTSEITVRAGSADIFSPKGSEELVAGRTMTARGAASDPEFQVANAIAPDEFERWGVNRDQGMQQSPAYQHISPDMPGGEEMDSRGTWVQDPTYGSVWQPAAAPGWAPYQNGRWVWEDYYGWTWVSYDPWGWAPYHYGRWFRGSVGWCWWPGVYGRHYFWSPALVGFFGFGGGFGFGFGFGNVGWVPLAPFEPFNRWWGPGFYGHGFGRTTIVNNFNVVNNFRNARFTNGVTAMSSSQFGRAGVNGSTMVRAGAGDLQRAGAVHGMLPLTPGRASLSATNRNVNPAAFRSGQSSFSGRGSQMSQGNRMSFEQQRQSMDQMARNTFSGSRGAGTSATNAGSARPSGGFGNGASGTAAGQRNGASTGTNNGWQRFNGMTNSGGTPANRGYGATGSTTPANRGYSGNYNGGTNGSYGRGYNSGGSYSAPSSRGYGSQQSSSPVRISPPMVSQRPNGGSSGGSSGSHPGFGKPETRSYGGGSGNSRSTGGHSGGGGSHNGGHR